MAYGTNKPFGLRPSTHLIGGSAPVANATYNIYASANGATTYATNIYPGDVVYADNTHKGFIGAVGDRRNSTIFPIGVFAGCEYQINSTTDQFVFSTYWPASTQVKPGSLIKAKVYDDPFITYEIQISSHDQDPTHAQLTRDKIFKNCDINIGGGGGPVAGNPADGAANNNVSAYYLDGSSIGDANPERMLKIKGYYPSSQNFILDPATGNVRLFLNALVQFNGQFFKSVGTEGNN